MAIVSETRNVKDFCEVALHVHGDILLEQGERDTLVIETEEDVLPKIKSEVLGKRLLLGRRSWIDWGVPETTPIRFRITMRQVCWILISGSGSLASRSILGDQVRLEVSGAGQMKIAHLEVRKLEADISGTGKLDLAGSVYEQVVQISGSGTLEALDLESQDVQLHVSGSGIVQVKAVRKLNVNISGVANVRYAGQPELTQHISGAGRIEPYKPRPE
jgi:hypothetical protein